MDSVAPAPGRAERGFLLLFEMMLSLRASSLPFLPRVTACTVGKNTSFCCNFVPQLLSPLFQQLFLCLTQRRGLHRGCLH